MGYTTEFTGKFKLNKPLMPTHAAYLRMFSETRRMARDEDVAAQLPDPFRHVVGLPIGKEGGYFVSGGGFAGQNRDASIVDYNEPPDGQPGLWCQWVPTEDGTAIEWNGTEKFYDYVEWITYLIEHFLGPWGYVLNGSVFWRGEDTTDVGTIEIHDNKVTTHVVGPVDGDESGDEQVDGDDEQVENSRMARIVAAATRFIDTERLYNDAAASVHELGAAHDELKKAVLDT